LGTGVVNNDDLTAKANLEERKKQLAKMKQACVDNAHFLRSLLNGKLTFFVFLKKIKGYLLFERLFNVTKPI
jgi:hypothetical protein